MSEPTEVTVFVAYPYDFSKRDCRAALRKATNRYRDPKIKLVYADERITNLHVLEKIKSMMRDAAFSLFDISTWNPNVALELGIAIGEELDYYILFDPSHKSGAVPSDVGGIDRIQYDDYATLTDGLKNLFQQQFGRPDASKEAEGGAGQEVKGHLDAIRDQIPALLEAQPGLMIGGVAAEFDIDVDLAKILVRPLLASSRVRAEGVKKGTRYYSVS